MSVNKHLNIETSEDYNKSKDKYENFIDNPKVYFFELWTNWYDFLGYNTTIFIQNIEEWKAFCKNIGIKDTFSYYEACKQYKCLPKEPAEFYKSFTNIINELGLLLDCYY